MSCDDRVSHGTLQLHPNNPQSVYFMCSLNGFLVKILSLRFRGKRFNLKGQYLVVFMLPFWKLVLNIYIGTVS